MLAVALISLALTVQGQGMTKNEALGDRSYIIHLPSAYDDTNDAFPLVINMHGYTSNASEIMYWSNMNQHADVNGYIAVYPQGKTLGQVDLGNIPALHSWCADPTDCVMDVTYWNDLSLSSSPGPDGPTCKALDPTQVAWLRYRMQGSECAERDVTGCNIADCRTDDIGFIEDLLDELEANYNVDADRVYATGFSNGVFVQLTANN